MKSCREISGEETFGVSGVGLLEVEFQCGRVDLKICQEPAAVGAALFLASSAGALLDRQNVEGLKDWVYG